MIGDTGVGVGTGVGAGTEVGAEPMRVSLVN